MRSLLYVSANFHSISDVWCFVVRSQDKRSNKKENLHLMSIWTFSKILELFCHKCKWNHHRPFQLVSLAKLLTQIQWKSKIFPSAAGRKWRDEDWGGPRPRGAVPRRWKPQWTPNLLRPTNLFPARLEFRRPRTFFRYKRWIRNLQNPQENVCRSDLFYCKGDCQQILRKPGTIISH